MNRLRQLAEKISCRFTVRPEVRAVAMGGSASSGRIDAHSDIDLYIFHKGEVVPLDFRESTVREMGASRTSLNLTYWDTGDEWIDGDTGIEVDIIYWHDHWISGMIDRVITECLPSVGYTTCFAHTIRNCQILFDPDGWLGELQKKCLDYPPELAQNIVSHNFPLLRDIIPSYRYQIEKAVERNDRISIQHRITELLASYFDIIFAVNTVFHPGEKRIKEHITKYCSRLPEQFDALLDQLLYCQTQLDKLGEILDGMLDHLEKWLTENGFSPR